MRLNVKNDNYLRAVFKSLRYPVVVVQQHVKTDVVGSAKEGISASSAEHPSLSVNCESRNNDYGYLRS
jgi:hypothetical protein